jgi:hypothetical protein
VPLIGYEPDPMSKLTYNLHIYLTAVKTSFIPYIRTRKPQRQTKMEVFMGCFKEMSIDWMQDYTNHWDVVALRDVSLETESRIPAEIEALVLHQERNSFQLEWIHELLG